MAKLVIISGSPSSKSRLNGVLGAIDILGGVYVLDTQVTWTDSGSALLSEEIEARLKVALQEFSQEALWQEKNKLIAKGV